MCTNEAHSVKTAGARSLLAGAAFGLLLTSSWGCSDTIETEPWTFDEDGGPVEQPRDPAPPVVDEQPVPVDVPQEMEPTPAPAPEEIPRCRPGDLISPLRSISLQQGGDNAEGYVITADGLLISGRREEGQQDLWQVTFESDEPVRLTEGIDREVLGDGRDSEFMYGRGRRLFVHDLSTDSTEQVDVGAGYTPFDFGRDQSATGSHLLGEQLLAWFEDDEVGVYDRTTGEHHRPEFPRDGSIPQVQGRRVAYVARGAGTRGIALWSDQGNDFLPLQQVSSIGLTQEAIWWLEGTIDDDTGRIMRHDFADGSTERVNEGPCTNLTISSDGRQAAFSCGFVPADHPDNYRSQPAPTEIYLHDGEELERIVDGVVHEGISPPWNGWLAYVRFTPRTEEAHAYHHTGDVIVRPPDADEIVVGVVTEAWRARDMEFEGGILVYDQPFVEVTREDGQKRWELVDVGLVYVCAALNF